MWRQPARRMADRRGRASEPRLKRTLDKPLTSYHLVLGVTGLLLSLGLLMVLSASSVTSLNEYGNSYAIFTKQAIWVVVGVPLALVASRLPIGLVRFAAWPALFVSLALIAMTYLPGFGVAVNGNQNWLSFGGPFQIQPSELAKLAMVLWCADVYSRKDRLLTQWRHMLVPMMPVCALVVAMVVLQGDLGTALVLFAIVLGMLWIIGAPARLFVGSFLVVARASRSGSRSPQPERVARLTDVHSTRSPTTARRGGRRATASSPSPPAGSGGRGSARATRSGETCRAPTRTSSSRSSARSSGCSARSSCSRSS